MGPTASGTVDEFTELADELDRLGFAIQDHVADMGAQDLGEDARSLHRLMATAVVRLRTAGDRASLAPAAARALSAITELAPLAAADEDVGRALDLEVDGVALVTEASRARVALELMNAAPVDPAAPLPISQSYLSELRNGKKSLPRAETAAKLDAYFGTNVTTIIDEARQQIAALRRQRAARPKLRSRFQRAAPGLRDDLRRQIIQEELTRRSDLIELVERVLALGPGHQRVIGDLAVSLETNTIKAGRRSR
jgi:transcriptional regulator with XRE-family HTH domain